MDLKQIAQEPEEAEIIQMQQSCRLVLMVFYHHVKSVSFSMARLTHAMKIGLWHVTEPNYTSKPVPCIPGEARL
jgi:hypothetical protein